MHAGRVVAQLAPAMSARRECCGTQPEVLRVGAFLLRRTSVELRPAEPDGTAPHDVLVLQGQQRREAEVPALGGDSEARSDTAGISMSMNTAVAPLDRSRSWLPPEKMLLTDL